MFYAHFILNKKGPLARIWLAAHCDKKLTKANIFETDIVGSVETIMSPKMKLALRTSGHLLVGVVRIYSRKTKYLLADCNEALIRIRLAFRPGTVDLPNDQLEADLETINLRPKFFDFESLKDISPSDVESRLHTNYYQSRPEDITLRVDPRPAMRFFIDDDFEAGEMDVGDPYPYEKFKRTIVNVEELVELYNQCIFGSSSGDVSSLTPLKPKRFCRTTSLADSGFGSPSVWQVTQETEANDDDDQDDDDNDDGIDTQSNATDETGVATRQSVRKRLVLDWPPVAEVPETSTTETPEVVREAGENMLDVLRPCDLAPVSVHLDEDQNLFFPPASVTVEKTVVNKSTVVNQCASECGSEVSTSCSVLECGLFEDPVDEMTTSRNLLFEEPVTNGSKKSANSSRAASTTVDHEGISVDNAGPSTSRDETTLIQAEANEFALEPVISGPEESSRKGRRKRKLIVDEAKVIASETMKCHIHDTSEILCQDFIAPPTKRLMMWKAFGCVEKLLVLPGKPLISHRLSERFSQSLHVKPSAINTPRNASKQTSEVNLSESPPVETEQRRDVSHVQRESVAEHSISDLAIPESSLISDTGVTLISTPAASEPDMSSSTLRRSSRRQLPVVPEIPVMEPTFEEEEMGDGLDVPSLESAINTCSAEMLLEELNETEHAEQIGRMNVNYVHSLLRQRKASALTRFSDIVPPRLVGRKQAAARFCALLALKKQCVIDIQQAQPFSEIFISRGPNFDAVS